MPANNNNNMLYIMFKHKKKNFWSNEKSAKTIKMYYNLFFFDNAVSMQYI